ncbi:MAG: hypothetical protein J5I94_13085, partial [Phaeodactylibacter sp.]|nr:hypothetical protein [Phaeodactylibacter sp.]
DEEGYEDDDYDDEYFFEEEDGYYDDDYDYDEEGGFDEDDPDEEDDDPFLSGFSDFEPWPDDGGRWN